MLAQIIKEKIRADGPISFADYMEMALYHPGYGFYTARAERLGTKGDFFTAPTYSPLFGYLVARQLEEMWDLLQEEYFTVVEYGAGSGHLCHAIVHFFRNFSAKNADKLTYCIVEKSTVMRELAQQLVPANVRWLDNISDVSGFHGCVLSNELLDNFAVHRVRMGDELEEIFVDYDGDFCERKKAAGDMLTEFFDSLKLQLPRGVKAEVNLQAKDWIAEVATHLGRGYVLTIDYGYPAAELLEAHRKDGTVTCYNKHRVNYELYKDIGEQDITAHVNFSALALHGYRAGLQFSGFTNQRRFLAALGFYDIYKKHLLTGNDYKDFQTERTLSSILLHEMGYKFKILIQHKNTAFRKLQGFTL